MKGRFYIWYDEFCGFKTKAPSLFFQIPQESILIPNVPHAQRIAVNIDTSLAERDGTLQIIF